jgi:hypothetical protein
MSLSFDFHEQLGHPTVSANSTTASASSATPRRLWNLSRLNEPDVCDLFVARFSSLSAPLLDKLQQFTNVTSCPPIDSLNGELNDAIFSALDQSVGSRVSRPKHWKKFWTSALQAAADLRESYYRKWRRASGIDKIYWWNKHQEAHKKFRQDLRQAKKLSWRDYTESLANDPAPLALQKIKQIKSKRQVRTNYTHPDGPAAGVNAMRDHLASVYSGDVLPAERPPGVPSVATLVPFGVSPSDGIFSVLDKAHILAILKTLPRRKAPGPDSLRAEMLLPIQRPLVKILSLLFTICYQWSYTPALWRHAQVVPIHKKGDATLPSNFRPISLTSIMRKLFEMCLSSYVSSVSPVLDVAQGGFRAHRSALDQALCLHDLIKEYYRVHHHYPVVAFLDIKAAYDTVDRNVVWQSMLNANAPLSLVSLLSNMFDEVSISVLLSNHVSSSFTPCTGVLQGSVLSPHLYSVYINSLAALLRSAASGRTTRVMSVSSSGPLPSHLSPPPPLDSPPSPTPINLLLYADDVALFGSASEVQQMLALAETHSLTLGYRWSPPKCAVLNSPSSCSSHYTTLSLYGEALPSVDEFIYLGVPFKRDGISSSSIVSKRKPGTMLQMSQLNAIGVNRSGFPLLFSSRLYAAFVRPKLEYGLAITHLLRKDYEALEKVQNRCLRMIFGGHRTASTQVFCHITNLPSMEFRADVLCLKYCLRVRYLPPDCLLSLLSASLPNPSLDKLRSRRMFQDVPAPVLASPSPSRVATWLRSYRQTRFDAYLASGNAKVMIRACRPVLKVDPIMFLPASRADRFRLIRWRMGWLPGTPKPCACLFDHTSRRHLQHCMQIPTYLWYSLPIAPPGVNSLDYALNQLPVSASAPCPSYWVDLCTILWHIDQLCNPDGDYSNEESPPGAVWFSRRSNPVSLDVSDERFMDFGTL